MRILFFTLGSPKKRIKNLEDTTFREDVVLYGPTEDKFFEIRGKQFPIIRIDSEISINSLLNQLPDGWVPDIVLAETPVLNYIPDFYQCPLPTLCISRDAWGEMIYNQNIALLFDYVSYQTVNINTFSNGANILPLFGGGFFSTRKFNKLKCFSSRKIDILAIANYNDGLYHERYRVFCDISAKLGGRYIIKIINGIKQQELINYYSDAKIVIDWSNVDSVRVYDAALNGCLSFTYKHNPLIAELWDDGKEFVGFDYHTLTDQLEYYLNHPHKSEQIIANAYQKLKSLPSFTGERRITIIKHCLENNANERRLKGLDESEIIHATATSLFFNYEFKGHNHPINWKELYFGRIDKALSLAKTEQQIKTQLIEALRMAFLLKKRTMFGKYFASLQQLFPEYPWQYYLNARMLYDAADYQKSSEEVEQAIQCYKDYPGAINEYVLPFYEKGNSADARRVLNNLWKSILNSEQNFEEKVFLFSCYKLLGSSYLKTGNDNKALECLILAVNQLPVPSAIHELLPVLLLKKDYQLIIEMAKPALKEYPYDIMTVMYLSMALFNCKNSREAIFELKKFRRTVSAFENKTRFFNKVRLKKILLDLCILLSTLNSGLSKRGLSYSIKVLHKAGVSI